MVEELVISILVLLLGYAYPAMECFKTMEKNKVQTDELRFWCQYWIILAFLTVFERVGEIFLSWVPMYAEVKLGLIIYLWYPKTKGTAYVYEKLLRPYVMKHGRDFDKKIFEWKDKAWDFAIYYWKNCTELGQSALLQIVQYFLQSKKNEGSDFSKKNKQSHSKTNHPTPTTPPPPNDGFTRTLLDISELLNSQPDSPRPSSGYDEKLPRSRFWFRRSKHH